MHEHNRAGSRALLAGADAPAVRPQHPSGARQQQATSPSNKRCCTHARQAAHPAAVGSPTANPASRAHAVNRQGRVPAHSWGPSLFKSSSRPGMLRGGRGPVSSSQLGSNTSWPCLPNWPNGPPKGGGRVGAQGVVAGKGAREAGSEKGGRKALAGLGREIWISGRGGGKAGAHMPAAGQILHRGRVRAVNS